MDEKTDKIDKTDKTDKTEFQRYIEDVEARYDDWTRQTMGFKTHANCRSYDFVFMSLHKRCQAPECGYPLPDINNFEVMGYGEVCNLCHAMYSALSLRAYWVAIQQAEDNFNKRKKWDERK